MQDKSVWDYPAVSFTVDVFTETGKIPLEELEWIHVQLLTIERRYQTIAGMSSHVSKKGGVSNVG